MPEQVLLVEKAVIVSETDVKAAFKGFGEERSIMVELTKAGVAKVGEATAKMRSGVDSLAIIVDGKLTSAPVIMGKLGRNFFISGLVH